ncbi:hypothetical protein [Desulfovibrio inopinatus]|uniref:hypothetical protein n=1 Tax=Desulfovibrio inopinatus TaxID=102109 RepID=UPI00040B2E29|nr:hypothetical protein [Desulfovibrio inopinatus]
MTTNNSVEYTCERPVMPKAQVAYGDSVYWICVVSALLCMIGPLVALIDVDNNVINPHYLFGAIWEGKSIEEIWMVMGNPFPGGHFWIDNMFTGDGLTQFGLVLGGSSALPALLIAAYFYMKDKPKHPLWAGLALWVSFLIIFSLTGILSAGH